MPGIYIHIPFCKKACTYCDFHFSTLLKNKPAMVDSICRETDLKKNYLGDKNLKSIYFGGGTPSLLTRAEMEKITDRIKTHFTLSENIEITLEANPDNIDQHSLNDWKDCGINRLSIGLQSFNNEELKWMNRIHNAEQSEASVKMAQDKGFDNISIDLIYGSKFQDLSSWEKTLKKAILLNVNHISSYNLTIEQKTALGVKHRRGQEPAVNDELSSEQFLMMSDALTNAGFIHYEVSNFGKENYLAVHNSNYWLGEHYIGLGPSAHSYNGDTRQWNIKNNQLYIEKINNGESYFEVEVLSPQERYNEYVLTRLRTVWGCDIREIEEKFGKDVASRFVKLISSKKECIEEKNGIYRLNTFGMLKADGIAADLFL